jgi:hypothetical protein
LFDPLGWRFLNRGKPRNRRNRRKAGRAAVAAPGQSWRDPCPIGVPSVAEVSCRSLASTLATHFPQRTIHWLPTIYTILNSCQLLYNTRVRFRAKVFAGKGLRRRLMFCVLNRELWRKWPNVDVNPYEIRGCGMAPIAARRAQLPGEIRGFSENRSEGKTAEFAAYADNLNALPVGSVGCLLHIRSSGRIRDRNKCKNF